MIKIFSFKITVISPERRINENSGGLRDDIYTSYQVESVNKDNIHRVWRRYNQFLLLVRIKESIMYLQSGNIEPRSPKIGMDYWSEF